MAKSQRSKIKRANRALKREKNSKKEALKLQKMVDLAKEAAGTESEKKEYTVLGASTVDAVTTPEEVMAVDGEAPEPAAPTNEDEEQLPMGVGSRLANGNFPVWMHNRAIKRAKTVERKKAKQKNKGKRAGSRPWRK